MLRIIVLSVSFCFFCMLGVSQNEAPKIYFVEDVKHVATLFQGAQHTYQFEFVNKGNSPLKINDVEVSCPCIEAKVSSKTLKKNEKGILTVKYRVPLRKGMIREKIFIYTNSKKKKKTIKIIGKILPNRI